MAITTADNKKRVIIPGARPGDVSDVQQQGEERVVFGAPRQTEAKRQDDTGGKFASNCCSRPLQPKMTWKELRRLTRES